MEKRAATLADLLHSPANFMAFGFGSGLAPYASGTFGTLPALLLCALLGGLPVVLYLAIIVLGFTAGIWFCNEATSYLGSHDHGAIVWDEIIGMLITMIAVPVSVGTLIAGFFLFRLFDVWKPWPIRWMDESIDGGLGIMIDDVFAGLLACIALHLVVYYLPAVADFMRLH
jgi:phosphatidylglycerophosphatase A